MTEAYEVMCSIVFVESVLKHPTTAVTIVRQTTGEELWTGVCEAGTPGVSLPRLHLSGRESWHNFGPSPLPAPSAHVKSRSNPRKLFPRAGSARFMQCKRRCSRNTTLPERPWAQIACGTRPINNAASWLFVYARGWCHFIVFSWTLLTAYLWRVTERKHPRMQMPRLELRKYNWSFSQSFDFIYI